MEAIRVIQSIQNRIYEIRGQRVMLDFDLAELYQVETKALNQAIKRNIKRFPEDFMFRLTAAEWSETQSRASAAAESISMRSQIVTTSQQSRRKDNMPYAFTEQGVAMLSGVLHSDRAIQMNIAIMRAFVEVRRVLMMQTDVRGQLRELKDKMGDHDATLSALYDAVENLLDEKAAQRKWEDRERIGFKTAK